jgi:hypothetical protein
MNMRLRLLSVDGYLGQSSDAASPVQIWPRQAAFKRQPKRAQALSMPPAGKATFMFIMTFTANARMPSRPPDRAFVAG